MDKQLNVLIYETAEPTKKKLHDVLVSYAIARNTEVRIDWIRPDTAPEALAKASVREHIAFVNASEGEAAAKIGKCLYDNNPDCALIYYGDPAEEEADRLISYFRQLFPARPVEFIRGVDIKAVYLSVCRITEQKKDSAVFVWENKSKKYRFPYGSILYFKSDRNYVTLKLKNGEEYAFLAKLADVEKRLDDILFVRAHQSYLINKTAIVMIDKSKKSLVLSNGEEIYISKAHYKDALEA